MTNTKLRYSKEKIEKGVKDIVNQLLDEEGDTKETYEKIKHIVTTWVIYCDAFDVIFTDNDIEELIKKYYTEYFSS